MNLAEIERKRGYVVGAADRIRGKIGLPIPDESVRIARIEFNMDKSFVILPPEIAVSNFNPQPKLKWKGPSGSTWPPMPSPPTG